MDIDAHTHGTSLVSCPYDVLLHLSTYLDIQSILALRTTSRELNDWLAARALQSIQVPYWLWRSDDVESPNAIGDHMIPSPWRFEIHTKHLHLHLPTQISRVPREAMLLAWGVLPHLRSLRSLRLTCDTSSRDPGYGVDDMWLEWVDRSFTELFKLMDGIRDFSIIVPRSISLLPPVMTKFSHLERLCVERCRCWTCPICGWQPTCDPSQDLGNQINDLITKNLSLESLQLEWGCIENPYALISALPSKGSALRRLTLGTVSASNITSSSIPFLASLGHLFHLKITSPYTDCNLDPLWKTWADIGANLETLETYQVSKAFVDFLSSFSGLQRLHIYHIADNPSCLSPMVTDAFFTNALLQHRQTLLQLEIDSTMTSEPNGWSFSPMYWPLSELASLREISVSPPYARTNALKDEYQRILDGVEEHAPHVGVLKIYCAERTRHSAESSGELETWVAARALKSNLGRVKKIGVFDGEFTVDWCAGESGAGHSGGFWRFLADDGGCAAAVESEPDTAVSVA